VEEEGSEAWAVFVGTGVGGLGATSTEDLGVWAEVEWAMGNAAAVRALGSEASGTGLPGLMACGFSSRCKAEAGSAAMMLPAVSWALGKSAAAAPCRGERFCGLPVWLLLWLSLLSTDGPEENPEDDEDEQEEDLEEA
jgi:hypothetical protein